MFGFLIGLMVGGTTGVFAMCLCRAASDADNCRSAKWDCRNPVCYRLEYQLTDQMIIGSVIPNKNLSSILDFVCKK